jgi:hypothetical protein
LAVKPRDYPHEILDLWQDFAAMEACAGERLLRAGVEIRIDLITLTPWREFKCWEFLADYPEPKTDHEDLWQSLGFDIAGELSLSGLSNCGYDEGRFEWRTRWASALNEHGLVNRLEDAFALCTEMDKRVEEHAPFFVFGFYQLPSAAYLQ